VNEELAALQRLMDERDRRYEERFVAMDEKTSLALAASEKAVVKAEMATEKRFDSVNEFRDTLRDQASQLLPRAEADSKFAAVNEKFEDIKKSGMAQRNWGVGTALAILALLISIAALVLRGFGK
jgi:hypothetical protein